MSAKPDLKVVQLDIHNFRVPAGSLRKIADDIEAGRFGAVGTVAVAVMGNSLEVFGSGVDSEGPTIALLFQAACLRFAKAIEEHGR